MAVVKDALGTELVNTPTAGVSFNYTGLTVVSNTNGAIVLTFAMDTNGNTNNSITSVTGYTQIAALTGTGGYRTEIWGKVGNSTGSQTIAITPSSTWNTGNQCATSAISVIGADQTGGTTTFNNSATNQGSAVNSTISITTTSSDLAVAVVAINNNASGMTKTAIYTFDTGTN